MSDFSPYGLKHARLLYPPLSSRICSDPCQLSGWCYLTISFSAASFSFFLQSFPVSAFFFPMLAYTIILPVFAYASIHFFKLLDPLLLFYGCCYSNPWKSLFNSTLEVYFKYPLLSMYTEMPSPVPHPGPQPTPTWALSHPHLSDGSAVLLSPDRLSLRCSSLLTVLLASVLSTFTHCPPCGLADFSKYNSRHVSPLLKISPWLPSMLGIRSKLFILAQWG